MNRLNVRLTLALVGVTLVTITLMIVPQVRGIAAERGALPPEQRPVVTAEIVGRALMIRSASPGPYTAYLAFPSQTGDGVRWESPPGDSHRSVRDGALSELIPGGLPSAGQVDTPPPNLEATVPRRDLLAYVRGSLEQRILTMIGSGSLALVLAVGLALLLARVIARPVETVTRAAGQVASGDLSVRIPVPERGANGGETSRLAHSFNAMADSLERLEENRKNMVADVAHELRTPLTIMRGRLEAMEDGIVPLEMSEIRDLHVQALMLSRLVDDLRTLSLAESGKLSLELQRLDLAELAQTVASGYQVRASDKGVSLTVEHSGNVPVVGDRDRLTQVMMNLLDNAIRHTPTGGRVSLVVKSDQDGPRFEVHDTGPGIPDGAEQRIFSRFVRTDDSRSRSDGGSGLGLAIVDAIVKLHRGSVKAWNATTGGAIFSVRLSG